MSLGPTIQIQRGYDRDVLLQVRDATDTALTTLLDTDTLAVAVWQGDDLAALATPTASWVDADAAKYLISFVPADTEDLAPGKYRIQATATRSTRTWVLLDGWLEVTATPGSTEAATALVTADQMLVYAPWLDDLATASDQAGFLEQRVRAGQWLFDLLCDRWRPAGPFNLGDRQAFGDWPIDQPSTWLRTKLEADPSGLIVRPKTREILAKKAIAHVLDAQVGREGSDNYRALAGRFHDAAGDLLKTYIAEIDVGSTYTGTVGLVIHCGVSSLR